MQTLHSIQKKENLCILRRHLGLTQKEFIAQFLSDSAGNPTMSIATFSNLESKGGKRLDEVLRLTANALEMDTILFSKEAGEFSRQVDTLLLAWRNDNKSLLEAGQPGKIDQLLHRLTMYFAEKLMNKQLKKGDKIESDRELARKMKVGRSAIREALKVLDVLGMIDIHPGRGTYISGGEEGFFIIPLSWSLFLNGNQAENILLVRNLLEVEGAKLAAKSADDIQRIELQEVYHKIEKAYKDENQQKFLDYDIDFHTCIAQMSANQVIFSMIQTISNLMKHISGTGMEDGRQMKEIYEEHQAIYERILEHDALGAGETMSKHLNKSVTRYNYR